MHLCKSYTSYCLQGCLGSIPDHKILCVLLQTHVMTSSLHVLPAWLNLWTSAALTLALRSATSRVVTVALALLITMEVRSVTTCHHFMLTDYCYLRRSGFKSWHDIKHVLTGERLSVRSTLSVRPPLCAFYSLHAPASLCVLLSPCPRLSVRSTLSVCSTLSMRPPLCALLSLCC